MTYTVTLSATQEAGLQTLLDQVNTDREQAGRPTQLLEAYIQEIIAGLADANVRARISEDANALKVLLEQAAPETRAAAIQAAKAVFATKDDEEKTRAAAIHAADVLATKEDEKQ